MKKIILSACCILYIAIYYAQPGSLDTTFGVGGKVITDFGSYEWGRSIAIQTDGKIVEAGMNSTGLLLVRYNSDGTVDNTFGTGGKVTTPIGYFNYGTCSVAIQSDGKILVAGYSNNISINSHDFALVRYNSDGTLDSAFSSDGIVITVIGSNNEYGYSVAIQSDGKIVLAGQITNSPNGTNWDLALVRYTTDGSLDSTFDSDGKVITSTGVGEYSHHEKGRSVVIQSDGKIVVAGSSFNGFDKDFSLVRYNSNGSLDNTFDSDGKVTTDFENNDDYGYSAAIQSDGKIVVAGRSYDGDSPFDGFAIVRYNSNGSLDSTFDSDGKVLMFIYHGYGNSVVIQNDGKIVVAGYSGSNFALARYNSNGSLDTTFNSDGKVLTGFEGNYDYGYSVAIQSDGKIVVAGETWNGTDYDFAIARYIGCSESSPFAKSPCDSSTVDIAENTEISDVSIYPNPTSGIFTVSLKNKTVETKICVYDVLGNCLWKKDCRNNVNLKIDLSCQSKGIYFMEIVSEGERAVKKIAVE